MGTMDVLSFPFRFDADTHAPATVVQRSDEHYAQQISQYVQTRPGDLPLAPYYGVEDTMFRIVHPTEITSGIGLYHPAIEVSNVTIYVSEQGTQTIDVEYSGAAQSVPVEDLTGLAVSFGA
jgi:phage baseplate assembly protein W